MVDVSNYPTHKQTYEPIATVSTYSGQTSVIFSSIPQSFSHLFVSCNLSMTTSTITRVRFNSDTGSNYSDTDLTGNGTAASSARDTSISSMYWYGGSTNKFIINANIFSYSNANIYKTVLTEAATDSAVDNRVHLWRSTSSINSIEIYVTTSFSEGSTFSLYGIAG